VSLINGLRLLFHNGVDFSLVWTRLWVARWRTLGWTFGTAAIAILVSFVVPYWYESGATLVVDTGQPMNLGAAAGMLGLAAQLGFGAGSGPTNPLFYEALFKSRSLEERVITAQFPLGAHGEMRTLEQYWSHNDHPTPRQHESALKKLNRHYEAAANPRVQQVAFKVSGPSRVVAKLMADTILAAINDLVVGIRRKHATAEREFLEGRFQALGDSLRAREDVLRQFYERNRTLSSPELVFEDARLRREVDRVGTVYAQLGSQLEQARVQEVRDTPALTVVDAPIEPVRRASPVRRIWATTAGLLGAALALLLAMADAARLRMPALRLQPAVARRSEQG